MRIIDFEGFGGVRLEAEAWGDEDQPSVLLLPNCGQTRRAWRATAQALAEAGRYAIALDLRGHGGSAIPQDGRYDLEAYAADLRHVLRQLPTRPVVIGGALGGLTAMAAIGETAEPVSSGLVLVGCSPWHDAEAIKAVAGRFRTQIDGYASAEAALADTGMDADAAEDLEQRTDGCFHWRWDPRFIDGFDVLAEADRLAAAAAKIKLPTLIVHGTQSAIMGQADMERLQETIEGSELTLIQQASHLAALDAADAFHAHLIEFLERRLPRAPIEYTTGSDARTLRDALGCFGTGVTIITAIDPDGKPIGLTANSFTSVSLDPPLVLFCVDNGAGSLPVLEAVDRFAVNVLHIGQQPTSNRFAARGIEDRYEGVPWEQWEGGGPILSGSLASFDCEKFAVHDGGDHRIFIGKVVRARFEPRRDPLLYFRGKYRRLHFG
jgi:flavin reductase (DIM6/NTAB) family NADH-FMN oxidoreductase RutF/pimeloyl-ACP methyl ester carboxylesterase